MSTGDRLLILTPAALLAAGAAWLEAHPLRTHYLPDAGLAATAAVSGALHAAWLGSAARRRAMLGGALCWAMSVYLAFDIGIHAVLAEIIALTLAMGLHTEPLADRFARWRRTRALIRAELETATGIWQWWRACRLAFFHNDERRDTALERARFLVEMRDAERVAAAIPGAHAAGQRSGGAR